jgi:hypothetical protein
MFSPISALRLFIPIPPTPMHATFSVALGARKPMPPSTCLGTTIAPNASLPASATKSRRVIFLDIVESEVGGRSR